MSGEPKTADQEVGFGIPFLAELVWTRVDKHGRTLEDAIASVGRACELRSEAIQKLREYCEIQRESL